MEYKGERLDNKVFKYFLLLLCAKGNVHEREKLQLGSQKQFEAVTQCHLRFRLSGVFPKVDNAYFSFSC